LAEQHSFLHSIAHESLVEVVPFEQDIVTKIKKALCKTLSKFSAYSLL
jgi:hypothetical protein